VPSEVERLLADLATVRAAIVEAAQRLPQAHRDDAFLGSWSVRDLRAHLIGWDHTNIAALRDLRAGRRPAFYDRSDIDWASYNAELVTRYRLDDWDALLAALRDAQRAFTATYASLSDADLDRDWDGRWLGRTVSLGGLLRAALRDEREHLRQVEAFAAQRTEASR
jgi:DinB superfamily